MIEKLIYTTPILRHPATGGPALRVENSIKALARICEVHLVARTTRGGAGGPVAERFLLSHAARVHFLRGRTRLETLGRGLRDRARGRLPGRSDAERAEEDGAEILEIAERMGAQAIWLGYGNVSYPLLERLKAGSGLPVIVDTDSVWSRFLLRQLPHEPDPAARARIEQEGRAKQEEERRGTRLADVTTAVSEVDAAYYRGLLDDPGRVHLFSNVIDVTSYRQRPPPPGGWVRESIYLSGSFYAPGCPMEHAARWLIEKVLPVVRRSLPAVHLYVVGAGAERLLGDRRGPGVTVTGLVPSVLPYLCNAGVAVVPLWFESGTRFKILEAGACGVAVVSTTLGAEGIPVEDGRDLLLADTAEAFADAIVRVLSEPGLAARLGERLRDLVAGSFGLPTLEAEGRAILQWLDMRSRPGER